MLSDIPDQDVDSFINVLQQELPQSFFIINLIRTCCKWKQKNKDLQISLLYTDESMKTGVFIGVLKSACHNPVISVYALDSYEYILEEVLKQTLVDLKSNIFSFEGIVHKHASIMNKLTTMQSLKMEQRFFINLIAVSVPIEEALNFNIQCPDDVELAPLSDKHLDEIYEIWLMKDVFTKDLLTYSLLYNPEAAYGVFCKNTGELLARCMQSYCGFLIALQTVEKARNKGYAKMLMKFVAKNMAQKGIQPCTYTADFNPNALNAMHSAGYRDVCKMNNYRFQLTHVKS